MLLLLIAALIICGCSSSPHWQVASIPSHEPDYTLVRLFYPADDPLNGIGLELTRYGDQLNGYLNVYHYETPYCEENRQCAAIDLSTRQGQWHFLTSRLKGGQRLRLSEEAVKQLTDQLRKGLAVTIKCGYFKQTFLSGRFSKNYQALTKRPSFLLSRESLDIEWAGKCAGHD